MSFDMLKKLGCLFAGLLMAPALFAATEANGVRLSKCYVGTPTQESYNWNFHEEATQLIHKLRAQSAQVHHEAAEIRTLTRQPMLVSWQAYANRLAVVREQVNTMGQEMCRLEAIQHVALPWQKRAIQEMKPAILQLADSTAQSILYTQNQDLGNYGGPHYKLVLARLSNRADRMVNLSNNALAAGREYAMLHRPGTGVSS